MPLVIRALHLYVLIAGFSGSCGMGKPLMRHDRMSDLADLVDSEVPPEMLIEAGAPGSLAEDLEEEAVGGPRIIRQSPSEESEDREPSMLDSTMHQHVDPKVAADWLDQVMAEGLHPLNVKPESAARDMDAWAKDTRMTFGDELMPTPRPRQVEKMPRAPAAKVSEVQGRIVSGGGQRQHFSLEQNEPESLPDEACFEDWGEWTTCSATCWNGGAWQKRNRARLANATTAKGCASGTMEEMKVCNRHIKCPIVDASQEQDHPYGDEALGCMVGDPVACPALTDYPLRDTQSCQGNTCCQHRGQSGEIVTSVCPSAEGGWGDGKCNFPKQRDCTGGISGYRVRIERHDVQHPDTEIGQEDPITLPKVDRFDHIQAPASNVNGGGSTGPETRAMHIATCSKHVCTEGWGPKLGLPENFPCEASPCTEVECCQLVGKPQEVATTAAPLATAAPVEIPVTVVKKMTTKEAVALDSIIAVVGVLFCFIGFFLGRKWTQFQHWMAERNEEAEEEKQEHGDAEHKETAAAGHEAAAPAAAPAGAHH